MSEQHGFLELDGHFEIFAAFLYFYEEELVLDVVENLVVAEVDLTAWIGVAVRMMDSLPRAYVFSGCGSA